MIDGIDAEEDEIIDWHRIIWENYFPVAYSIGIHIDEFMHLTPKKLEYCLKGYKLKLKREDEYMHSAVGTYGISALAFVLSKMFSKYSDFEYIDYPMRCKKEYEKKKRLQVQLDFVAHMNRLKANFDKTQKQKKKE